MRTGLKLLGIALVMALLAACGGGSGDETTTTQAQATTSTQDDTTTTGAGGPDGGLSGTCLQSSQAMAEAMERYGQSFGGTGDTTDFDTISEQLEAAAEVAPAEIREDFEVLATELGKFYEAMGDFEFAPGQTPTPEQMAAMQAAIESVDQDALETASTNIEAWFEANCD